MHDLELQAVRVVEEDREVARRVEVLLRPALDLRSLLPEPVRPLDDDRAGRGLEGEVVQADPIAVDPPSGLCACRSPIELPGPQRYQIVSPRSPSTSVTPCQPSGASRSR